MPQWLQITLAIILIVVFAVSAIIALLDMVGLVEIRKEYQRKTLFGALVVEIIGIVIGWASGLFSPILTDSYEGSPPLEAAGMNIQDREPATKPGSGNGARSSDEGQSNGDQPSASVDDAPTANTQSTEPVAPDRILAWAGANLPPRPALPKPPDRDYPQCVSRLRSLDITGITRAAASNCFRSLDEFNTAVLLPYQFRYGPYTSAVRQYSEEQTDEELLEFLRLEYSNFTDTEGPSYMIFNNISNIFQNDHNWLRRLK